MDQRCCPEDGLAEANGGEPLAQERVDACEGPRREPPTNIRRVQHHTRNRLGTRSKQVSHGLEPKRKPAQTTGVPGVGAKRGFASLVPKPGKPCRIRVPRTF